MGWLNDLCETYDNCQSEVAVIREGRPTLLPIAHSTQNALIEITVDVDGKFLRARPVEKNETVTIIPVNEDSSSRSGSAIYPHPLCDKLEYVAGDYCNYIEKEKPEKFEKYISQLGEWVDSDYSCEQVDAIYNYLCKKAVMKDLIGYKVLQVDEDGNLAQAKINGMPQEDALVRFCVDIIGEDISEVYKNIKVFQMYTDYYVSQQSEVDLCYATGETVACGEKHPAKIRNTADKAKLISANDKSGFTFRGRLSERNQAANVGYQESQKAHNALRWLVEKQGFRLDEQMIVAWENHDEIIPLPQQDTFDAFEFGELFANYYQELEQAVKVNTGQEYAKMLEQYTMSYTQKLDANSKVTVMGLEAATTGRLSITFYQNLQASDYLERIKYWHKSCSWIQSYKVNENSKDKKDYFISYVGAPSAWDIVKAICGYSASDKIKKSTLQRLLPCIVEKRDLPRDMMISVVNRVSSPMSFDSKIEYKRTLEIACALIRKYYYDTKGEECKMGLDFTNTKRDYLYGRLLALAQKIEEKAQNRDERRDTNAERLHQQFLKKPAQTWVILWNKLQPYISRLNAIARDNGRERDSYLSQIGAIINSFELDSFSDNTKLNETYLQGYFCQLYNYNNSDKNQDKSGDDKLNEDKMNEEE